MRVGDRRARDGVDRNHARPDGQVVVVLVILRGSRGGGTSVALTEAQDIHPEHLLEQSPRVRFDMSPFRPSLGSFPRRGVATAVARVLRDAPDERLGLPDPAGTFELRSALASYLGRARGVRATANQVVITMGMRHGLALVWQVLARAGATQVGIEQPGWIGIRDTATAAGMRLVPLPVDDDGLQVKMLQTRPVDVVAVAPAHQYPTGAVLAAGRRLALIAWARNQGKLVIEDDYDAEYRYDHQAIGSLQGLAPEYVIYGGSTSKTLAPSLRIGWMVVPPRLVEPILALQQTTGTIPPTILQLALADMIKRGEVDRHLRRQRRRYQEQRAELLAALAGSFPELPIRGAAAGLYVVIELPPDLDEAAVVAAAAARGIALEGRGTTTPALVIGFAGLHPAATQPAVAELAVSIHAAGARRAPATPSPEPVVERQRVEESR